MRGTTRTPFLKRPARSRRCRRDTGYDAVAAQCQAKDVKDVAGELHRLLANELRNITFSGEQDAADQTLTAWGKYIAIDGQVRALENAGQTDAAITLCTGPGPEQSNGAYQRFDDALGRTLDINEKEFAGDVAQGTADVAAAARRRAARDARRCPAGLAWHPPAFSGSTAYEYCTPPSVSSRSMSAGTRPATNTAGNSGGCVPCAFCMTGRRTCSASRSRCTRSSNRSPPPCPPTPCWAWAVTTGKAAGEFNPILYRTARFDLKDSGTFWLSETPTVPGFKELGQPHPTHLHLGASAGPGDGKGVLPVQRPPGPRIAARPREGRAAPGGHPKAARLHRPNHPHR